MKGGARASLLVLPFAAVACAPVPPVPPQTLGPSHLIVAVGDSYGSGQGAPDQPIAWWKLRFQPAWQDRRCNRSSYAGARQAVDILEKDAAFAGHAFVYQSFACSGASIERGMLAPYRGSEPPDDPSDVLPPQVEEVRLLAQQEQIDALIMTIGGNDILFEYIVAACLLGSGKCNLVNPIVQQRITQLDGRLVQLADALAPANIPPDRIFIAEYPDPTYEDSTTHCDHKPDSDLLGQISACEARWVSECVLPRLNYQICKIAENRGWHYVDGIADGFRGHGWCAPANWINTIGESLCRQGHYRGGVHPNANGYEQIGAALASAMRDTLLGTPSQPTVCVQPQLSASCSAPCG